MLYKFSEVFSHLLVGLLAVLIPIFALMTSMLARAIEDGREKLEKDIQRIFKDIQEIRKEESADAEIAINELKKAIRRYSWLRSKARFKQFLLSTRASVYYPGLLFLVSLLLLVPPLSSGAQTTSFNFRLVITAVSLSVVATGILCGVIRTLYSYASTFEPQSQLDVPDLQVFFSNGASVVVWPAGTTQRFQLLIENAGDYLAETLLVSARFQPDFKPQGKDGVRIVKQPDEDFIVAFWEMNRVYAHMRRYLAPIQVTVPATKGEFSLRVRPRAAKMRMTQSELKIVAG